MLGGDSELIFFNTNFCRVLIENSFSSFKNNFFINLRGLVKFGEKRGVPPVLCFLWCQKGEDLIE